MAKIAFIFPGQGSQYLGMGKDFYENYPRVQELFTQADAILGINSAEICFCGPEEKLKETINTQPLVYLVSMACLEVLKEKNIRPDIVAGHSLGEYSALVAAGALDFSHGLELVHKRAQFMQQASLKTEGTMAALLGLEKEKVSLVLEEAESSGIVVAANFNSPGQIVISGQVKAVERARKIALDYGAKKVVFLPVGGAFHSPLMKEAQENLNTVLASVNIQPAQVPVVANVRAQRIENPVEIKDALVNQITSAVLWDESVREMNAFGAGLFIEVGPGKVLSNLVRRILPEARVFNVEDNSSLAKMLTFREEIVK